MILQLSTLDFSGFFVKTKGLDSNNVRVVEFINFLASVPNAHSESLKKDSFEISLINLFKRSSFLRIGVQSSK